MTRQELMASTAEFVRPKDIADILGVDPQGIRDQANLDPSKLGFAVARIGSETLIPREAFLRWLRCGNAPEVAA